MSLDDDLSGVKGPGRHPLPARDSFAETLGAVGIGNSSVVVAYDDSGGAFAARAVVDDALDGPRERRRPRRRHHRMGR